MSTQHVSTINLNALPAGKEMGKIKIQTAHFGAKRGMLVTVHPGGSWSADLKALHGTESCQNTHFGFVLSGKMGVRMDDGEESTVEPNDLFFVPAGHDAYCVGDEPAVFLEFAWDGE